MKEYQQVINDQLKKGIIEVCNQKNILINPSQDDAIRYICLIIQSSDKIELQLRYEWSMMSSESGLSLNDCLQTGPTSFPNCSMFWLDSEATLLR